nr:MAG: hypothetical protein 2 [Hangzhou steitz-like virus 4]
MAFPDPLKFGGKEWSRLADGKYILTTTSPDEPTYLYVKSNLRTNGTVSDYLFKIEQHRNNAMVPGSPDAVLTAHFVIRVPYGLYSTGDVGSTLNTLVSFVTDNGASSSYGSSSGRVEAFIQGQR